MANIILECSLGFLIYTYLLYPLIIWLMAKWFGKEITKRMPNQLPQITVVLCVYNSEKIIEARIRNIFALCYPTEKLNVIVVADGCTDNSCEKVQSLGLDNVKLVTYEKNHGKSYALSQALQNIETDLVLFSDVRQRFEEDVLQKMLPYFSDESIGAVTGNLLIEKSSGDPGLYWRYEKAIRKCESDYLSIVGVTGAIYMARTKLLPIFPTNVVLDDMYGPLSIIRQKYRVVYCEEAYAYDSGSLTLKEEFDRKVRTLAGNYQLFSLLPWTLNPFKNPVFFELFSHKICRLLVPYFMILTFISSALTNHWFGIFIFYSQLFFYGLTLLEYFFFYKKKGKTSFILSFIMLNLAALKAGLVYWIRPTSSLWKNH
ncbi:glycosyltransferase family 2 protein [Colwellia sp. KU-HH00111]|uniref:glycosyltransferase family 2 protein n=1 Tax=Colwellia sp. KU-HH00111 TaxID=3127652 RepID=UPI003109094D